MELSSPVSQDAASSPPSSAHGWQQYDVSTEKNNCAIQCLATIWNAVSRLYPMPPGHSKLHEFEFDAPGHLSHDGLRFFMQYYAKFVRRCIKNDAFTKEDTSDKSTTKQRFGNGRDVANGLVFWNKETYNNDKSWSQNIQIKDDLENNSSSSSSSSMAPFKPDTLFQGMVLMMDWKHVNLTVLFMKDIDQDISTTARAVTWQSDAYSAANPAYICVVKCQHRHFTLMSYHSEVVFPLSTFSAHYHGMMEAGLVSSILEPTIKRIVARLMKTASKAATAPVNSMEE